jgi:hypothetical protein
MVLVVEGVELVIVVGVTGNSTLVNVGLVAGWDM